MQLNTHPSPVIHAFTKDGNVVAVLILLTKKKERGYSYMVEYKHQACNNFETNEIRPQAYISSVEEVCVRNYLKLLDTV